MASSIDTSKPEEGAATTASVRNNFSLAKSEIEDLQTNKIALDDKASQAEAEAGASNTTWMSPLRAAQHFAVAIAAEIGSTVQAWSTALDQVASGITAFGLSLIDDADAAAARSTMELGTAAVENVESPALVGLTTQGDVLYHDAAGLARLAAGTSGQFLQTQGAGANPQWADAGADWEIIDSGSVSSAASLDITDLSTTYRAYKIVFDNLAPATDGTSLYLRTSSDNGSTFDTGAADYGYAAHRMTGAAAFDGRLDDTASAIVLGVSHGNDTNEDASGEITIFNPGSSAKTRASGLISQENSSGVIDIQLAVGARQAAAAVDAIRLLFSSGNIATMNYTLYGLRAA